jgi:ferredoxin
MRIQAVIVTEGGAGAGWRWRGRNGILFPTHAFGMQAEESIALAQLSVGWKPGNRTACGGGWRVAEWAKDAAAGKHWPVSEATRRWWRAWRGVKGGSWFEALHGYVYVRWTYHYIGLGIGELAWTHPWRRLIGGVARLFPSRPRQAQGSGTFADGYHGKVLPLETARQLVQVQEEVRVEDLERVIPYRTARALVLEQPDHLVALECPCRRAREKPCQPLDVCLIVGEPFASFVLERQADRARAITADEAVQILEAEHARGHAQHAFFKDAMLGRFYAICNCCPCCCGAVHSTRNGTPMLASSGYVVQVDPDECMACEECAAACLFGALAMGPAVMQVDPSVCLGCGICVSRCEEGALTLVLAPERGVPLDLTALLSQNVEPQAMGARQP